MDIQLTKLYDCRTVEEVFTGEPLTIKAEFIDAQGITYSGWKYVDDTKAHYSGFNHRFFQSSLPSGKKCSRKVSAKINKELLSAISLHTQEFDICDWYYWPKKGGAS